jgi:hypothetical protein
VAGKSIMVHVISTGVAIQEVVVCLLHVGVWGIPVVFVAASAASRVVLWVPRRVPLGRWWVCGEGGIYIAAGAPLWRIPSLLALVVSLLETFVWGRVA